MIIANSFSPVSPLSYKWSRWTQINNLLFLIYPSVIGSNTSCSFSTKMANVTVSDNSLVEKAKTLAPPFCSGKHKGQAGRIGVFGGSVEFTGAPYFSSIAALRVGADLSYVFTIKDAAFVIKSYSPELMVLPFLDDPDAINKISPWVGRLHVALLGPGMGCLESTKKIFEQIINLCRSKNVPLIIDADGLFFVAQNPDIIKSYPVPVILTPNKMEFRRLVGENQNDVPKVEQARPFLERVGSNVTLFCKDADDEIITLGKSISISGGGSGRRCGGQGDMLAGAMSTFLVWALEKNWEPAVACYAASKLTRDCNSRGFSKYGRSMLVTDMLYELPNVFKENFELNENINLQK